MTTREEVSTLVQRMQECFNSRQFDEAGGLHTPGFVSHPLGTTGFEAGKAAWRTLAARFPGMRVVAQDILVDGDKAAVRSVVKGIATPDGAQPMLFEIFRIDDGRFAEMWGPARDSRPRPAPGMYSASQPQRALLTWDDKGIHGLIQPRSRSTCEVNAADWPKGLSVTADGSDPAQRRSHLSRSVTGL